MKIFLDFFELNSRVVCLLHEEIGFVICSFPPCVSHAIIMVFDILLVSIFSSIFLSLLTFLSRCHCRKIVSHFYFFFQGGGGGGKSKFFNEIFLFCDWTTSKLKGRKNILKRKRNRQIRSFNKNDEYRVDLKSTCCCLASGGE